MLKKIAFLLLLIAPMSVFAQKFAHFKSMDIIPVMPEYAKAQTDIETMRKQYEDEIKRASDEFNKKYAEYQQEQKNLPQNIPPERIAGPERKGHAVPAGRSAAAAESIR